MADFRGGGSSTQANSQTGALFRALPGQQSPRCIPRAGDRRIRSWRCLSLLAAVGLLLASQRWQLGYNIEVSYAEKGVYVPAGILKPQRSFEQKRTGRRRVSFENELQHDDGNTQEQSGPDSGRSASNAVSFHEAEAQGRVAEGQKSQKQGALRRQSGRTQHLASYSNLEHHSASVHEHADHKGVYERQSSESSDAAEESTGSEEFEDDGVNSGQRLSRVSAGGSLASVNEDSDKIKRFADKWMRSAMVGGGLRKTAEAIYSGFRKRGKTAAKKGSQQHKDDLEAEETEAR